MYFEDRIEAGQMLSKRLQQYRGQKVAVMALSTGGVLVGEYIAKQLGAQLTFLLTREISIPGEPQSIGSISQTGDFTYNSAIDSTQAKEFEGEFHNHIEAEKMNKMYELNRVTGKHKVLDRHMLTDHVVILVADGLVSSTIVDAAYDYLKPIRLAKLVGAVPFATVSVVDRLHILTDEIHCLNVLGGQVFQIDHYYTDNKLPNEDNLLSRIDLFAKA